MDSRIPRKPPEAYIPKHRNLEQVRRANRLPPEQPQVLKPPEALLTKKVAQSDQDHAMFRPGWSEQEIKAWEKDLDNIDSKIVAVRKRILEMTDDQDRAEGYHQLRDEMRSVRDDAKKKL